jgi:hypothetical protein
VNVLVWLSNTAPAVWARSSESIWAYPTILFLHTFGLAILVGFTAAIDFRVLGFSPSLPLAPLRRFFRFIWIGFWINAVSGTMLLIMAPAKLANPAFLVKMTCIALGVVNMLWLRREVFGRGAAADRGPGGSAASSWGRMLAASSLALWAAAITAGRLMAYVGAQR